MAKSLSPEDRDFFTLVTEAAFANPFGSRRHEVDVRLAEAASGASRERVLEEMIQNLWMRLTRIGPLKLSEWESGDRELIEYALLFSEFHKYSPQMDEHIQRQLTAAKPLKAPFGAELVHELVAADVPEPRALRAVALFYQIRRAFYFISTSLLGDSRSMVAIREQVWNNIFTHDVRTYEARLWDRMEDFSTFLVGETGSGKGTAAAAIGRSGWIPYDLSTQRFEQSFTTAFLAVNVSEFSESLVESELFGHRKGAFTGAIDSHTGVFQRCEPHGTIFLDEIGDVSVHIQIKLLRVLQERLYSPVGSHEQQRFPGRVLAATNRPIGELRESGAFRDDFYYRLCSDVIEMPTLRQRIRESDTVLPMLVRTITGRIMGEEGMADVVLDTIQKTVPEDYAWPGNVRELEQAARQIILTGRCSFETGNAGSPAGLADQINNELFDARELVDHYCKLLYERHGTYEEVARITGLDRRTVKKHVVA